MQLHHDHRDVDQHHHDLDLDHDQQPFLDPPVDNEKCVFVTKNDHFLKGPVFAT